MLVTNALGGALVILFLFYVLPLPREDRVLRDHPWTWIVIVIYLVIAAGISVVAAGIMLRPVARWYLRGGAPTRQEQSAAMRAPLNQSLVHLALWIVGGILFTAMTYSLIPETAVAVMVTVCLAAVANFGGSYMLGERILRPVAARAMSEGEFAADLAPGVWVRLMLTWGLGTLVPVIGIIALCVTQLNGALVTSRSAFAISVLVVAAVTAGAAFLLSMLTAGHISDPIRELRRAIEQIEAGQTPGPVDVYDGSEVGMLQVGFNRMVRAADERRRIQNLFGRHVGEDVARRALEHGTELGGETRFVAVLFIDLIGSTKVAAAQPPTTVVELLNEFFRIVVSVVHRNGGIVNKFVGDEAFAVFGAPLARDDSSTAALTAARELHEELRTRPEFDSGIGVSAGIVVAGNVGAAERFEYTVIGDPVNEAARLTELAKHRPGRVLASSTVIETSNPTERARWNFGDAVTLRGRSSATQLAWPVDAL
ncbi:HAMP domain-containing protein [Rhodococcus sp. D2-41]|uniref:Adenylate/guanylate cyclase domain-containing protein n=1 Tax=Speluncibacter jeojiensis TaxID=2710754 RepID=A0A9X4RGD1_9ACTN|nr:adenylate/guanylate cyclase domain-containing protein [Rhodococcus sp. D2-41]MDG3010327.1 HAMP domain-containing protein [Rhodococcus sp. D2-41]MDG3017197.1 adenylate/guanylate cyclase domain-containing protein [Corynebacteriales bacterium D3-21]